LILTNIFFVALAYAMRNVNINITIPTLILCAFGGFALAYFRRPAYMVVTNDEGDIISINNHSRIMPLTTATKKAAEQN